MILFLIWSVVVVAAVWLYLCQAYSRFSRYGVKYFVPVPFLGNMSKVLLRREHYCDNIMRIYTAFPEDRFAGNYEFMNPVIQIRDLDLIKKITVKDFEYFLDHRALIDEQVDPFFGSTLFSLKGQKWKDMRSTLSPAFTSSKIRLMVPFMVEIGEQMITSLKNKIKLSQHGYVDIDSKDLLTRYTNDVIASCAFGLKVDSHIDEDNQFYRMGKAAATFDFLKMIKFFGYAAFPYIMKKLKVNLFSESSRHFFRHLVTETIKARETNNIHRNDMIHLLMEAKNGRLTHEDVKLTKDDNAGFATVEESDIGRKKINRVWTDDDLVAQAVVFFFAGFETVSTAVVFLLYELAINPDVQDKLVQEIKQNWEENKGEITFQSVQHMTYMDMVVSEILRLWTPLIFTDRMCVKDYNLGKPNQNATKDYIIRKGEGIAIPIWAIHHSPEYFPNPDKFDPERFSAGNKHNIKPFTYIPFGLGPRNCIGSRFALCEIKIVIYLLLLHMEVSPAKKTRIPAKLSLESFNLRIQGGHSIRFKHRN